MLFPNFNARTSVVEPPQGAERSIWHVRQLLDACLQLPQLASNVEMDRNFSGLVWDYHRPVYL